MRGNPTCRCESRLRTDSGGQRPTQLAAKEKPEPPGGIPTGSGFVVPSNGVTPCSESPCAVMREEKACKTCVGRCAKQAPEAATKVRGFPLQRLQTTGGGPATAALRGPASIRVRNGAQSGHLA